MQLWVDAGIPPAVALQAATWNAAQAPARATAHRPDPARSQRQPARRRRRSHARHRRDRAHLDRG